MKQKLKYLFIICLLTVMMFSLTACDNKEPENADKVDEQAAAESNEEKVETKKVNVSSDHTKWPVGVYDVYGIPEYTAGTLVFAAPNDELGRVYYSTTFNELKNYINLLLDKGFRISEEDKDDLDNYDPTDPFLYGGLNGTIYAPEKNAGFVLNYGFSEESTTQTMYSYEYDMETFENGSDSVVAPFNMSLYIELKENSKKETDKDLFVKYGVTDEYAIPKFDYNFFKKQEEDDENYDVAVVYFGYDSAITTEDAVSYMIQLQKACKAIADDGKLYDSRNEKEIEIVEEGVDSAFTYIYQGTVYRVMIEKNSNIGESSAVVFEKY